jgi:ABC-type dipeptide/oligopeptide/nickel transport system permease component
MGTYIARRLLFMIPTLLGITFLVFMLVAMAPGGIGATLTATAGGNLQASSGVAVQQAYLEDRYGLTDPVLVQYVRWLGRISPLKFGTRDQVLPSGEVISAPKKAKEPPLWRWFADELPQQPLAVWKDSPSASDEERVRLWRRTERDYAGARFKLLETRTKMEGALVGYARAAGLHGAVTRKVKPDLKKLANHEPRRELPEFARVEQLGRQAIDDFGAALQSRAALQALFGARPFPQAGVPIIPGAISLAAPDFGTAFSRGRPSIDLIKEHLPVTLMLNIIAIPIIYMVAIPSGILAATRRGSLLDVGLGFTYIALYSFPVVLAGILAIGFLASRDYLNAFPVAGLNSIDAASYPFLPMWSESGFQRGWLLDRFWHIGLPVMCLVYTGFAVLSKQTRAAMLENFNADYVRTAKAKGVADKDVIFRHVFRNSLLPLITIFVTIFPAMLAGSVVVERIFSVRGMGWLVIEAIGWRDRELILANTVIVASVNLVALLLADLLYAIADPRVTYD